ncbi:histidinol-phosphate transaminase [Lentibacillus halophilus]|uniref:Histidinol-phosphate aminotransferase n=1 Tax=Lentibacillus halophilus TaxID=295065 RepID=A0ABP3J718_9BACI
MRNKDILEQMTPYKPGKRIDDVKNDYGLNRIVKLASNENPYGCSDQVYTYMAGATIPYHFYPDGYASELRKTLASKWHVSEKQLLFGAGTDEIVQMIARAFLYPGANTVMAAPTFPQYKHGAWIEGAEVTEVPLIDGYHDLSGMLDAIDDRTTVVWLCSPNNPTGCAIPENDFYTFMNACPSDVLVVLDEAYYEYMSKDADPHVLNNLDKYDNLIVLRTFSKAYGLAGLRVGYGIASESLIKKLDVIRGPFNVSSLAQEAASVAIQDNVFLEQTLQNTHAIKNSFEHFLDTIGWQYYDSETNFLLISTPISGTRVHQHLLENGFIVKAGEDIGAPRTIRVTIGEENDMEDMKGVLRQMNGKLDKE